MFEEGRERHWRWWRLSNVEQALDGGMAKGRVRDSHVCAFESLPQRITFHSLSDPSNFLKAPHVVGSSWLVLMKFSFCCPCREPSASGVYQGPAQFAGEAAEAAGKLGQQSRCMRYVFRSMWYLS